MQRIPQPPGAHARRAWESDPGPGPDPDAEPPPQVASSARVGRGRHDTTVLPGGSSARPAPGGADVLARFGPPAAHAARIATPNDVLQERLTQWAQQAPPREANGRHEAVARILRALDNGSAYLNLNTLGLTTLPTCLHRVECLRHVRVSHNLLTALPALPPGLLHLEVDGNRLACLPPRLAPRLERLDVAGSRLEALPRLARGPESLPAAGNRPTTLPEPPAAGAGPAPGGRATRP